MSKFSEDCAKAEEFSWHEFGWVSEQGAKAEGFSWHEFGWVHFE